MKKCRVKKECMKEVKQIMKDFLTEVENSCGGQHKCILKRGMGFSTAIYHEDCDRPYTFTYSLPQLYHSGKDYKNGLGMICANMVERAPYMRGFSQITRVLLHEFGHQKTTREIKKLYGAEELQRLYKEARLQESNILYLQVPTEWAATQWAIEWLADSEHRKIAKNFEKKFWACFREVR